MRGAAGSADCAEAAGGARASTARVSVFGGQAGACWHNTALLLNCYMAWMGGVAKPCLGAATCSETMPCKCVTASASFWCAESDSLLKTWCVVCVCIHRDKLARFLLHGCNLLAAFDAALSSIVQLCKEVSGCGLTCVLCLALELTQQHCRRHKRATVACWCMLAAKGERAARPKPRSTSPCMLLDAQSPVCPFLCGCVCPPALSVSCRVPTGHKRRRRRR